MYKGIYLVFIRSLCIFVDILTVCYTFIHIKYEYNITLSFKDKTKPQIISVRLVKSLWF